MNSRFATAGFLILLFISLPIAAVGCSSNVILVQKAAAAGNQAYLIEVLQNAEEDWLIEDAAWGLARIGNNSAVAPLTVILENPAGYPWRRAAAAYALGHIGDSRAVEPLVAALERASNPEERYWIVVALGAFSGPESRAALESLTGDADILVCRAAKKGLLRQTQGGQ